MVLSGTADASSGIVVPVTGQTTIYYPGDDGEIQSGLIWPDPRFTDNGDGTVTDNLTGLIWLKDGNCFGRNMWEDSLDIIDTFKINPLYYNCMDLTTEYDDWRLPNINELESLVNSGASNNAIWLNNEGFINVQQNYYWSSTTYIKSNGDVSHAYVVGMERGNVHVFNKRPDIFYSLPVRAGQSETSVKSTILIPKTGQVTSFAFGDDGDLQTGVDWPSPRFKDNGDGTVTDNLTGLMWLKDANCFGSQRWRNIINTVADFNINSTMYNCSEYTANYTDWELPNRKELFSLIDYEEHDPALPSTHPFINAGFGFYWSSTTNRTGYPSAVGITNGYIYTTMYESHSYYGWPVRGDSTFQTIEVVIDIKPGSSANPINRKSKGKVPVAILSGPDFFAEDVDVSAVIFAGAPVYRERLEDINEDGLLDLILHFETQELDLEVDDTEACLSGRTFSGEMFEGCDTVRIK